MDTRTARFQRTDRLVISREYRDVGRRGRRVSSESFTLLVATSAMGQRLGITVSKKVGNAVARNSIKRRIREWFRQSREELQEGIDVVVIARPAARQLTGAQVDSALDRLTEAAGARR